MSTHTMAPALAVPLEPAPASNSAYTQPFATVIVLLAWYLPPVAGASSAGVLHTHSSVCAEKAKIEPSSFAETIRPSV